MRPKLPIAASAAVRRQSAQGSIEPRSSVAIMRLANPSGDWLVDQAAGYFTELLIVHLSGVPWLRVASRTSSELYKSTCARLPEIARALKVSSIVQGSVLELGSQIQVAFSLVDAGSDASFVSRTYTGQTPTILRMRSAIAKSMADDITTALQQASWSPLLAHAS